MKENSTSVHFDAEPSSPDQLAPEEQTLPISPSNGIDEKATRECNASNSTCLSGKKEVGSRGESGVLSRGRKKRYLRGQILAIRKAFSEEQWLQYAKALYGDALKSQPFKKCEIVKESTSDMPKTKKTGKCVIQTKKQNEQKSYEMKQNKAPLLASKTSRDKTFGILDGKCRRMKANFYHELSVEMGNKMERGTSTTVATQTYSETARTDDTRNFQLPHETSSQYQRFNELYRRLDMYYRYYRYIRQAYRRSSV
ncbi:unnamed protein product [Gongylonema pulchrum]|uniref:Uncharacterized protein n=1 Tax=Gongylonema pulchrum TaxID=637853 RepID=A0A183EBE4_9BILA|nr:unnamed protein product [Gongylonema pulchrum]